jgi:hypothetical protein
MDELRFVMLPDPAIPRVPGNVLARESKARPYAPRNYRSEQAVLRLGGLPLIK